MARVSFDTAPGDQSAADCQYRVVFSNQNGWPGSITYYTDSFTIVAEEEEPVPSPEYPIQNRSLVLEQVIADLHVRIAFQQETIEAHGETVKRLQDRLDRERDQSMAYARRLDELLKAITDAALLARKSVI